MKNKLIVLLVLCVTFLSGCWDHYELEERGFVLSIGIDKGEDEKFAVTLSIPDVAVISGGEGDEPEHIKSAEGGTIADCINRIDSYFSQKLYFGFTKVAVIGKDVLSDKEIFSEAVDAIQRNYEISNTILVFAAENAKEILSSKSDSGEVPGLFAANYYKNNPNDAFMTLKLDLEGLAAHLREDTNALIPAISVEEEKLRIKGAALIHEYVLSDFLEGDDITGYSYVMGGAYQTEVAAQQDGVSTPVRVQNVRRSLEFSETNEGLNLNVSVKAHGFLESYSFINGKKTTVDAKKLEQSAEEALVSEINHTFELFQKKYKADGFSLLRTLEKQNPELYAKYKDNWNETFPEIAVTAAASVTILSTGAVK